MAEQVTISGGLERLEPEPVTTEQAALFTAVETTPGQLVLSEDADGRAFARPPANERSRRIDSEGGV